MRSSEWGEKLGLDQSKDVRSLIKGKMWEHMGTEASSRVLVVVEIYASYLWLYLIFTVILEASSSSITGDGERIVPGLKIKEKFLCGRINCKRYKLFKKHREVTWD